jgi:exodeoxyribonuclease VII small subunit
VSKAAKASAEAVQPAFEEAVKKLESILEAMESDDLPLEQLLQRFEEGTRLYRLCQERLAEAEVQIQRLEQGLGGELAVQPDEPTEGANDTETV